MQYVSSDMPAQESMSAGRNSLFMGFLSIRRWRASDMILNPTTLILNLHKYPAGLHLQLNESKKTSLPLLLPCLVASLLNKLGSHALLSATDPAEFPNMFSSDPLPSVQNASFMATMLSIASLRSPCVQYVQGFIQRRITLAKFNHARPDLSAPLHQSNAPPVVTRTRQMIQTAQPESSCLKNSVCSVPNALMLE